MSSVLGIGSRGAAAGPGLGVIEPLVTGELAIGDAVFLRPFRGAIAAPLDVGNLDGLAVLGHPLKQRIGVEGRAAEAAAETTAALTAAKAASAAASRRLLRLALCGAKQQR